MSDTGYNVGTISVAANGTTVTGVGTSFTTWIVGGYPLFADGKIAPILSITDDTHLELAMPWPGSTLSGAAYYIEYLSKAVLDFSTYRDNVRKLVATLAGATIMVQVPDDEDVPDPALGDDGWFAVKVFGDDAGSAWKFWLKSGGVWVAKGSPIGVVPRGAYDPATTYLTNDLATYGGVLYISKQAGNIGHVPPSNPSWWDVAVTNGDRYDLASFDTDRPASGELIVKIFPYGVTFPAGLGNSYAGAEAPAEADAVFTFTKNGTQFATLTFSTGSAVGVFSCAADTSFNTLGDCLRIFAPTPRDQTLSGVAATIIGSR